MVGEYTMLCLRSSMGRWLWGVWRRKSRLFVGASICLCMLGACFLFVTLNSWNRDELSRILVPEWFKSVPVPLEFQYVAAAWRSPSWPAEKLESPVAQHNKKDDCDILPGAWVVPLPHQRTRRTFSTHRRRLRPGKALGIEELRDDRMVLIASLPGVGTTSSILHRFEDAPRSNLVPENYALFPFSPASVNISGSYEDGERWRYWDFSLSAPRSFFSGKDAPHYDWVVEAGVGVAASWNSIRRALPRARFIMTVPTTPVGALTWWNGLVAWLDQQAACELEGHVPMRVRASLAAYIAPLASDPGIQAALAESKLCTSSSGVPHECDSTSHASTHLLRHLYNLYHSPVTSSPESTASLGCRRSKFFEEWVHDQPLIGASRTPYVLRALARWAGLPDCAEIQPLLWTLASVWHARMAEKVFSTEPGKPRLLLVDVARATSFDSEVEAAICAFVSDLYPTCMHQRRSDPLRVSPIIRPLQNPPNHFSFTPEANKARCEAAGGKYAPRSPVLPLAAAEKEKGKKAVGRGDGSSTSLPPSSSSSSSSSSFSSSSSTGASSTSKERGSDDGTLDSAGNLRREEANSGKARSYPNKAPRAPGSFRIALVLLESSPGNPKRYPSIFSALALVESLRRFGGPIAQVVDPWLFHVDSIGDLVGSVLADMRIRTMQVPYLVPTSSALNIFFSKYHATAFREYDRVIYMDTDVVITGDLSPFLFAPKADDLMKFINAVDAYVGADLEPNEEMDTTTEEWSPYGWPCSLQPDVEGECQKIPVIEWSSLPHSTPDDCKRHNLPVSSFTGHSSPHEFMNGGIWFVQPGGDVFADAVDSMEARQLSYFRWDNTDRYQLGGGFSNTRKSIGWFQYGDIPRIGFRSHRMTSHADRVALAARMRGFAVPEEPTPLQPYHFTLSATEQGMNVWYFALVQQQALILSVIEPQRPIQNRNTPWCHFVGRHKPWKKFGWANFSPPSCMNLVRPLIESILTRMLQRYPSWPHKPTVDKALAAALELGDDPTIQLPDTPALETLYQDWTMHSEQRRNFDWEERLRKAYVDHVEEVAPLRGSNRELAVRLASAWVVCRGLPSTKPISSSSSSSTSQTSSSSSSSSSPSLQQYEPLAALLRASDAEHSSLDMIASIATRMAFDGVGASPSTPITQEQRKQVSAHILQTLHNCITDRVTTPRD